MRAWPRNLGEVPEVRLVGWGLLLNAAWEFLQSPLYTDHVRGFNYVLWTRLHCTVGDALILLGAFWGTSIVFRGRRWWARPRWGAVLLFLLLGLAYTAWSERYNTEVRQSWEYAAAMPRLFGLGAGPLFQWLLLPPVILALVRWTSPEGERTHRGA
jgi:hypothetical protein